MLAPIMPSTPHIEKHFTASEAVRDVVIGMSDGLTVPFALAAGLSGAAAANRIVIVISAAFTAAALFGFGFVKARVTAMPLLRGGLQTLAVGGLAAAAAFLIARLIA